MKKEQKKTEKQKDEIVMSGLNDLYAKDITELCLDKRFDEAESIATKLLGEKTAKKLIEKAKKDLEVMEKYQNQEKKKKTVKTKKTTIDDIREVIGRWVDENKGDVAFHIGLIEFDKNSNTKDEFIGGYGVKEVVELQLEEYEERLKKEKDDFINW